MAAYSRVLAHCPMSSGQRSGIGCTEARSHLAARVLHPSIVPENMADAVLRKTMPLSCPVTQCYPLRQK